MVGRGDISVTLQPFFLHRKLMFTVPLLYYMTEGEINHSNILKLNDSSNFWFRSTYLLTRSEFERFRTLHDLGPWVMVLDRR